MFPSTSHELKHTAEVTAITTFGDTITDNVPKRNRDEEDLARFGKKQQLRRNFKLLSIVALTCTLMVTWEGALTTFQSGLLNGGPAGLVYGFIFAWIGTILQALVMGEMASMVPLAGGQYNWVAVLAPPSCSKFLSYLTGWLSVISWQAALAGSAFLAGTMIQGLIVLNNESYNFQRWHGTLILYAILLLALFVNTYLARILPQIEAYVLILHIVGFFCVLIPLVYLAPHHSAREVFATFTNAGGWEDKGLSFFVGISTGMFAFLGVDAGGHMAEEIQGASTVIPRSMIASTILNGALGLSMVIAALFCMGDIEETLTTPTGFPFMEVFRYATGTNKGATLMVSVVVAAFIFMIVGVLATASRMAWAFAREQGLPGSSVLVKVHKGTKLPLYTICMSVTISMLLGLINIGSSTAFNAMTSLCIAAFYSCYVVAAGVMLHKRLTTPLEKIPFGPFKLGRTGIPIIIASIVYSVIGIFFSFWPAIPNPEPMTMNWSIVVFGGALVFCFGFWAVHGKNVYKGPLIEINTLSTTY
ncbi:amino acid transporter-like protein [Clohesyomyces aquaticus]|uniref:Amino acid transporter-like protein n=1 Tax=Clohesyomyces aquaticus TaxID=1231657 RepID=A0A1Y1YXT3_9PLEO|nr:amino acid transporter-like protein [Clohesyomyces aquaticus]